jgi:hypothetical protein
LALIQLRKILTVGSKLSSWPEKVAVKRLVELGTLGWCRGCYDVNRLENIILGCSQMSGHHLHLSFVKFDGEMNH